MFLLFSFERVVRPKLITKRHIFILAKRSTEESHSSRELDEAESLSGEAAQSLAMCSENDTPLPPSTTRPSIFHGLETSLSIRSWSDPARIIVLSRGLRLGFQRKGCLEVSSVSWRTMLSLGTVGASVNRWERVSVSDVDQCFLGLTWILYSRSF